MLARCVFPRLGGDGGRGRLRQQGSGPVLVARASAVAWAVWMSASEPTRPPMISDQSRAATSAARSGSSQCRRLGSVEGTSHTSEGACGSRTSCLGCFMPRRARRRLTAPYADARHSTSDRVCSLASGCKALRRRCDRRACQLVSLSAFPIERQAGSRISSFSWPQARRSRAIGHRRGDFSAARCTVSSLALWHPQLAQSRLKRATVSEFKLSYESTCIASWVRTLTVASLEARNRVVPNIIGQRDKLLNVLGQRLGHCNNRVCHWAAAPFTRKA